MGFSSANSCCCFDLKTGGLILGYLDLIFCGLDFFVTPAFSFDFNFALLSLVLVVPWLYGIYANKYLYMIPYLIGTVITATLIWIAFVVVTVASVFGLGMIEAIYQYAISESSIEKSSGIMQANVHSPNFDDALARKSLASGFIFLIWLIYAIITAICWYFSVVIISLYKQMKAESFGQQTLPLTQNSDFEVSQIGNFGGYPQFSQTGNFGIYPHAPQMENFEAIKITK